MFFARIMFAFICLSLLSTHSLASQPKEIRQTNITDGQFVISWITDTPGTAAVSYGQGTNSINLLATDNRLASTTHYVEISSGLSPNTTYYYDIISGGVVDNNHGQHYQLTTGPSINYTGSDLVYGQVYKANEGWAAGAIVYVRVNNLDGKGSTGSSSELSTIVGQDGGWSIELANARTQNLSSRFEYSPSGDSLSIFVQAGIDGTGRLITDTANDSPCQSIRVSTDTTAPGKVGTLKVGTVSQTSVVLTWTPSGDDGYTGTPAGYEVRYSVNPINESNWLQATLFTPKPAGTAKQCTVSGLLSGTGYHFAIKACDEVPNWSGISDIVAATTLVPSTATLRWLGKPNLMTDGLRTEIGTNGMNIVYQVVYQDTDSKPPANGYPKIGIYREGIPAGTYTMLYASGNYSSGAVYTFSRQFTQVGTYAYQFDGGNAMGTVMSDAHLCMKVGPIILESLPDHQVGTVTDTATPTTSSDLIYGNHVYKQGETQSASDAVVYVRIRDNDSSQTSGFSAIGSTTVGTNGTWYMELANLRDVSLSHPFYYSPNRDYLHIWINGASDGVASQILMTDEDTPACDLELCNDHIPPATVSLTAKTSGPDSIKLTWTPSGDDGNSGQASWYHIRYATSSSMIADKGIATPLVTGSQTTITGLAPSTTYYFLIQASDDVWNTSQASPIIMGTTAPPLQRPPVLSLAAKPLTPGTANVYTKFTYNVRYADADGDPPSQGEPRVVIYQGGKVVKTVSMTYVSGSYITGATYTCSILLPDAGTYSYIFEAGTSSLTGNGPLVFDTPKHLRITNVTDKGFTVSWRSMSTGTASVSYGTRTTLGSIAVDNVNRDVHYVTVSNLEPDTVYYFDVAANGITDGHYLIKTGASIINTSPGSDFVTGYVYERKNILAEGAVVYVTIRDADGQGSPEESAPFSVLTDTDGRWFMDVINARSRDYLSQFVYSSADTICIEADGGNRGQAREDVSAAAEQTPDIILYTWLGAKDKLMVKDMTYSYPNPAKQVNSITFRYYLNNDADVTVSIYNLAGELIQTIKGRGLGYNDSNELVWDISDVASDIYIWRLEATAGGLQDVIVKRLVVVK